MAGCGLAAENSLYLGTSGTPKQTSCLVLLFGHALFIVALGGSVGLL